MVEGETHLNKLLTNLNIPNVNHQLLKHHEEIGGVTIEEVATTSCLEALRAEKEATIEDEMAKSASVSPTCSLSGRKTKKVGIIASYDGGWQKRGSGRSYNSRTGHGTAVGKFTKKCIAFSTRNLRCRKCGRKVEIGNGKKGKIIVHKCRRNFTGSSKAMEADIAAEIFTKNPHFEQEGVELKTLIGDEDSTVLARLRREVDHQITKWTDINHASSKRKKLMYGLKVPSNLINSLCYYFGTVLKTNKDNVEGTRRGILNIVPHAFGEHDECGSWCKYAVEKEEYKYRFLPGGKPLTGDELRSTLTNIFRQFANSAEKLSPCGSSQANESLNMIIASKAPKSRHYGGSSSNDFRVAAAVSQKNLGTTYVENVFNNISISPLSRRSMKFRQERDRASEKRRVKSQSAEFKKRRRQLFDIKNSYNSREERREGISYQSGSGFDVAIDFHDMPAQPISSILATSESTRIVFFDIETTGFQRKDEIIQIGARLQDQEFNAYILPSRKISEAASLITGLEIRDGDMYFNSCLVETTPPRIAIADFLKFLQEVSPAVILVAHNGFSFDFPRILQLVKELNMLGLFMSVVYGFSDTLHLFRAKLPERKLQKKSFKQEILAKDFLGTQEGCHNALADVGILGRLTLHESINITFDELVKTSMTVRSFLQKQLDVQRCNSRKHSLQILQAKKEENGKGEKSKQAGISAGMITRLAVAGITLEHLQKAYNSGGAKAIALLLGQNVGKGPRVTTCKRIVTQLVTKLDRLK